MDPVEMSSDEHRAQSGKSAIWKRGLFMLLFLLAFGVAQSLLYLIAVIQFVWLLAADEPNRLLAGLGKSLARWLAETARFLSCAADEKPFPWAPWPSTD